jgi:ABC-type transport system involved in multi-copper enzyme maturation permease subunit
VLRSVIHLLPRGLFGPVFDREIRVVSRRVSTFWVRALYTLGLAALASLIYFVITVDIRFGNAGNASALQQLQMFAPTLGAFFAWFQFVIMCFVASTLTAGAICDERRKGSLSSLLATPLTPAQIVLGKFSGRLVQLIILIAAGIPLLLAVRLFGGISPGFVLSATLLTISTALVHASIALAASARVRSSTTAASSGFATGVVWCFAPMILTLFLSIGNNGPRTLSLLPFSPYFSLGMETAASLGAFNAPFFSTNGWLCAIGYNAVGCILFLSVAASRLRKIALGGEVELPPKKSKKRAVVSVAADPADSPSQTRPTSKSGALDVWDNPLAWRELRQRIFVRRWHGWVMAVAAALLLTYVYIEAGINAGWVFFPTSAITLALFYFQSALIAANSIAGERESRSLEVLLTTPLTARAIVRAKWLGALRKVSPLAILYFTVATCFGVLPGTFHWVLIPHLALITLPPIMFLVATGVWFSVMARRSTVAATLNLGLGLTIWVGFPLVLLALGSILLEIVPGVISEESAIWIAVWNPAPMVVTAIQGADYGPWSEMRPTAYHSFFQFTFWTFTLCAIAFALVYGLLTWLALRLGANSLARRTNRAQ